MRVLVTGGNGFLGSWLVRRLLSAGHQVSVLARPTSDLSLLDGLRFERRAGDVEQPEGLSRALEGIEVVHHLAGIRRASTRAAFFAVNAEGTRHICEALARAGGRRLVLCSSLAAVGPSTPQHPHVETDPLRPADWYGESKAEAERLALAYSDRLEVAIARPPRILGPGDKENLVFFKLAERGLRLELTGGPRPVSLVAVQDVAELLALLGDRPEAAGEAFFVDAGEVVTLEGLMDMAAELLGQKLRTIRLHPLALRALGSAADVFSRATGRRLPLNRKLAQQLLAPAWTCSAEKAKRVLGFRARVSVTQSLAESLDWYREKGLLRAAAG